MTTGTRIARTGLAIALTRSLVATTAASAQAAAPAPLVATSPSAVAEIDTPTEPAVKTRAVPILAIIGAVIAVGGPIFMTGFENTFYSMIHR